MSTNAPPVSRSRPRLGVGIAALCCCLPAWALAGPAPAAVAPPAPALATWLRLHGGAPDATSLQSAVATFADRRGRTVVLVAAIHLGERDYYRALQRELDWPRRTLYELIKPPDQPPPRAASGGEPADGALSGWQRRITGALGLVFQLDALDYARPHFVHADLDPARMTALLRDRAGAIAASIVAMAIRDATRWSYADGSPRLGALGLLLALAAPDRALALKRYLARELVEMGDLLDVGGGQGGLGATLIAARNEAAVQVLQRELAGGHRRLGVFFGAAHMPDLQIRIEALGFRLRSRRWIDAWRLQAAARH